VGPDRHANWATFLGGERKDIVLLILVPYAVIVHRVELDYGISTPVSISLLDTHATNKTLRYNCADMAV